MCEARISNGPMAHLNVCVSAIGGREHPVEAKKTLPPVWLPIASCIRLQVVLFDYWEHSTESNPYSLVASTRRIQWESASNGAENVQQRWRMFRGVDRNFVRTTYSGSRLLRVAESGRWIRIGAKSFSTKIRGLLYYRFLTALRVRWSSVRFIHFRWVFSHVWHGMHSGRHYQYYLCHSIFIIYWVVRKVRADFEEKLKRRRFKF